MKKNCFLAVVVFVIFSMVFSVTYSLQAKAYVMPHLYISPISYDIGEKVKDNDKASICVGEKISLYSYRVHGNDIFFSGGSVGSFVDEKIPNKNVKWSSIDPTVATVDPYGIVTGLTEGVATILAENGGDYSTVVMMVKSCADEEFIGLYFDYNPYHYITGDESLPVNRGLWLNLVNIPLSEKRNIKISGDNGSEIDIDYFDDEYHRNLAVIDVGANIYQKGKTTITATLQYKGKTLKAEKTIIYSESEEVEASEKSQVETSEKSQVETSEKSEVETSVETQIDFVETKDYNVVGYVFIASIIVIAAIVPNKRRQG